MSRWARKIPCPPESEEGRHYKGLPPLQRPYAMRARTGTLVHALGENGLQQLQGMELLSALEGAPHLVRAQTDLEALVAGFVQPWRLVQELQPHAPHLNANDWARIAETSWMLPMEPKLRNIPFDSQLLLYRIGAWRQAFAYVGKDMSDSVAVWDNAPELVQRDPLMQCIVAFKMPTLFQSLVERAPNFGWDAFAQGLFVQNCGFPDMPWLHRATPEFLRLLLVYHPDNTKVNALEPWFLDFSDEQLPIVQHQHPALFFQGLVLDRERREDPRASVWFASMWAALLDHVHARPSYADTLLNPRILVDDGAHLRRAIEMFHPGALATFAVSQSLHSGTRDVWQHWLVSHAGAKHVGPTFALPDLSPRP